MSSSRRSAVLMLFSLPVIRRAAGDRLKPQAFCRTRTPDQFPQTTSPRHPKGRLRAIDRAAWFKIPSPAVLLEQRCQALKAVRFAVRAASPSSVNSSDDPALLDGEAAACLHLGIDRVATLGPLVRGDPDIDDRLAHGFRASSEN